MDYVSNVTLLRIQIVVLRVQIIMEPIQHDEYIVTEERQGLYKQQTQDCTIITTGVRLQLWNRS
jgi:hypothetical protein